MRETCTPPLPLSVFSHDTIFFSLTFHKVDEVLIFMSDSRGELVFLSCATYIVPESTSNVFQQVVSQQGETQ